VCIKYAISYRVGSVREFAQVSSIYIYILVFFFPRCAAEGGGWDFSCFFPFSFSKLFLNFFLFFPVWRRRKSNLSLSVKLFSFSICPLIPGRKSCLIAFSFVFFFLPFFFSVAAEIGEALPPEMVEAAKQGVCVEVLVCV
jgi:hypothetical protein